MLTRSLDGLPAEPAGPAETSCWPVYWNAVWIGALSALAICLVTGLAGVAVGAHIVGPGERMVSWRNVQFGGIAWAVLSAFLSFVAGGWIAGKIAGQPRSESAMLHGAITWLITLPLMVAIAALGAGGYFGSWYGGLAGSPVWVNAVAPVDVVEAYTITRNNALGTVTALLLGLIGSVVGGWMASGEPMTIFHYRLRDQNRSNGILTSNVTTSSRS